MRKIALLLFMMIWTPSIFAVAVSVTNKTDKEDNLFFLIYTCVEKTNYIGQTIKQNISGGNRGVTKTIEANATNKIIELELTPVELSESETITKYRFIAMPSGGSKAVVEYDISPDETDNIYLLTIGDDGYSLKPE